MSGKHIYRKRRNRSPQEEQNNINGNKNHSPTPMDSNGIQRAIEDPNLLTPDMISSLQASHGNAFVSGLVAQRTPDPSATVIQRADDDGLKAPAVRGKGGKDKVKPLSKKIVQSWSTGHLKKKLATLRSRKTAHRSKITAFRTFNALGPINTPLAVIDELSIVDLHVKDFVNFVKSGGKTRDKRKRAKQKDRARGKFKRITGRTGFRAGISGVKSHDVLYGDGINNGIKWGGVMTRPSRMFFAGGTELQMANYRQIKANIRLIEAELKKRKKEVEPDPMDNETDEDLTQLAEEASKTIEESMSETDSDSDSDSE